MATILGAKRFAVLLTRFEDSTSPLPFTRQQVQTAWTSIAKFWEHTSYGKVSLVGSEVFDWRTYPSKRADFTRAHTDANGKISRQGMIESVKGSFAADVHGFDYFIVIFPDQVGTAWAAGSGAIFEPTIVAASTICHEMTHQLGEPDHSWDQTTRDFGGGPGEYCDQTDMMSARNCWHFGQVASDPFSGAGPHHCMFWKDKFGWLDGARVARISDDTISAISDGYDKTFRIYSRSGPVLERLSCIQVLDLWIELNLNNAPANNPFYDQYDNGLPTSGVAIHQRRILAPGKHVPTIHVPDVVNNPDQKLWSAGQAFSRPGHEPPVYVWIQSIDLVDTSALINISNTFPPPLTRHQIVAVRTRHSSTSGEYISQVAIADGVGGHGAALYRRQVHDWITRGRNSFFVVGSSGTSAEVVADHHWIATHPDSDPSNNLLNLPRF